VYFAGVHRTKTQSRLVSLRPSPAVDVLVTRCDALRTVIHPCVPSRPVVGFPAGGTLHREWKFQGVEDNHVRGDACRNSFYEQGALDQNGGHVDLRLSLSFGLSERMLDRS
jgi:hypothetical protein